MAHLGYDHAFDSQDVLPITFASEYPSFFPTTPSYDDRVVDLGLKNPFVDDDEIVFVHPRLRGVVTIREDAENQKVKVNSFIKAVFDFSSSGKNRSQAKPLVDKWPLRIRSESSSPPIEVAPPKTVNPHDLTNPTKITASRLPRDFGGVAFYNSIDRELFWFCRLHSLLTYAYQHTLCMLHVRPGRDISIYINRHVLQNDNCIPR
jgi:hypothetical protein